MSFSLGILPRNDVLLAPSSQIPIISHHLIPSSQNKDISMVFVRKLLSMPKQGDYPISSHPSIRQLPNRSPPSYPQITVFNGGKKEEIVDTKQ
jgi:hypothetical protein